jgi:competence protein ComEC
MRQPLVRVALLYGGGVLLGDFYQPPPPWLLASTLLLCLTALCLGRLRPGLIPPLALMAGWTGLVCHTSILSPLDLRAFSGSNPVLVTVRGQLEETPRRKLLLRNDQELWRTQAELKITSIRLGTNWQAAAGKIMTLNAGLLPALFFAGQQVEVSGVLAPPPGPLAEGLFDYRNYLRRRGIYYQLKTESATDWQRLDPVKKSPPLSDRFLDWARVALARGLPAEDEALRLEFALTLGDKTVLNEDVSEPFVQAATYHIFAVDGLRMGILFGIFFTLLRVMRLPRWLAGMLLIPLIWFYVGLTGWPASAIRATVMLTIVIAGWALKRPADLINSLFAAGLVILIWDPQQLFQAGFQLSFFVVLCIILVLPAFDRMGRVLLRDDPLVPQEMRPRWQQKLKAPGRFCGDLFCTSLAAWLGSIPLAAYYFHIITPVSTPANMLAVPLCALVLAANWSSLLVAGCFPPAAQLFNHAGWFLMESIRVTSQWCAEWPGAYLYVRAPAWHTTAFYYAVLLAVFSGWLFKPRFRGWRFFGLISLTLAWGWQWQRQRSATRLSVLPLNGGSAVFCRSAAGEKTWLADCGNTNSVEFVLKPFLRAQGINHLPCLILTCGETRQMGGAELLAGLFTPSMIASGSASFRSANCRQIIEHLAKTGIPMRVLNPGETLGRWTVASPPRQTPLPRAADNTMVLRGDFPEARVLLLSQLGRAGQTALLANAMDLRADIVVCGLPLNEPPLGENLLTAINPKIIILVDSEFPAQFRAGTALRERLSRRGCRVICTRESGAVTITLGKGAWKVETMDGLSVSNPSD